MLAYAFMPISFWDHSFTNAILSADFLLVLYMNITHLFKYSLTDHLSMIQSRPLDVHVFLYSGHITKIRCNLEVLSVHT